MTMTLSMSMPLSACVWCNRMRNRGLDSLEREHLKEGFLAFSFLLTFFLLFFSPWSKPHLPSTRYIRYPCEKWARADRAKKKGRFLAPHFLPRRNVQNRGVVDCRTLVWGAILPKTEAGMKRSRFFLSCQPASQLKPGAAGATSSSSYSRVATRTPICSSKSTNMERV